ncbi:DNA-directed DNA polymerase [Tanacetum coccineum]
MQEVILFYNGLDISTKQILDTKGAIPTKTSTDEKITIQEMAEYSQKWHNGTSKTRSTETSDGLPAIQEQHNNLRREIKKVNEKVYDAQVGCELCKGPHYTKDCPLKEEGKIFEEANYTQFGVPFQQGGKYRAVAKRHEENSNMIKEIQAVIDAAIRNQGASIKTLEIQIKQMSKVLQEKGFRSLPSSTKTNSRDHIQSILVAVEIDMTLIPNDCLGELARTKLTVELANRTVKHPKGIAKNVLVGIGKFFFLVDFIILDMPEDINVPLILGRPFLSTAHAKVYVIKRKITLRVGDEKIISVKPASSLIKRVYRLSLRERMYLNLEAKLMGETFILNRSFDPLYGDYIKLNDLNEPLELRRNQVDVLEPTVKEGEVVNEPMIDIVKTRCDFIGGLDDYPSNFDFDRRIHIDYAYNLKFSCMMGFEYVHASFLLIFPINVMSKKFYNSIIKDKIEFNRRNELGNFINAPIFIRNFYVITDFTVVEDMDPYHDEGMRDVIVGEPFC